MIMPNLTKFTWTDGTSDEISLTKIDDNFTAKYGRQKADLKELSIGEEVRSIESNAFKMCKNLEKVSMSPSVEKISVFAFAWCEKLTEIDLPEGLETISISAFTFCTSLKKIRIPDSVTLIDDEAFSYCTDLEEIILPKNLNCIYVSAFINCKSVEHLTIPASTETIDGLAFANCVGLKTLEFEEGSQLKEISSSTFSNCPQMQLKNPEALTKLRTIGDHAFEDCTSLEYFPLPEGLTNIGTAAFRGCSALSGEVVFPPSMKKLSSEVFANCISLERAKFVPREKYSVGPGFFAGCEKLEEVTGLNNAVEIGACAFMGCTSLKELKLGAGLRTIGDWAFKGCISLMLNVPASVTDIGEDAFAYTEVAAYAGEAEGAPWGACVSGPLDIETHPYFPTEGRTVRKEHQLKLTAFDLVWYLQYLHRQGLIADKMFGQYEDGILKYTRGDDNEYILANLLSGFDDVYGSEEFPLNADVEKFRDRLYFFSKELV